MKVFILVGGLGTRLRPVLPDTPKPLAPIDGVPFIQIVLKNLVEQGLTDISLLTGYQAELVERMTRACAPPGAQLTFFRENSPLGTGGAVRAAIANLPNTDVMVLNGDTYFPITYEKLIHRHYHFGLDCTMALKPSRYDVRYMMLTLGENSVVSLADPPSSTENAVHTNYLNAGVYVINSSSLLTRNTLQMASLENDYLVPLIGQGKVGGVIYENEFLDIGTPADYRAIQQRFRSL